MVLTAKLGMIALLLAATPLDGGMPGVWAQWGLAGAVVAFTLWRDHAREQRMGTSLEDGQTWVRETLVQALERNTSALERMAGRPCQKARGK